MKKERCRERNFTRFLAGRGGKALGRFGQEVMPTSLDAQLPAWLGQGGAWHGVRGLSEAERSGAGLWRAGARSLRVSMGLPMGGI